MAKTLIISGTVKGGFNEPEYIYDIWLYGQTDEYSKCIYITSICEAFKGYSDMHNKAVSLYANYFKVSTYNLIVLEHLIPIN